MLTWYFCIAQILDIIRRHIYKQYGQHKNKTGLTYSPVYYPFASTHMVNTQLLRVQNVQNIANIFAGFWIRACWILHEFGKNWCATNISTFTVEINIKQQLMFLNKCTVITNSTNNLKVVNIFASTPDLCPWNFPCRWLLRFRTQDLFSLEIRNNVTQIFF